MAMIMLKFISPQEAHLQGGTESQEASSPFSSHETFPVEIVHFFQCTYMQGFKKRSLSPFQVSRSAIFLLHQLSDNLGILSSKLFLQHRHTVTLGLVFVQQEQNQGAVLPHGLAYLTREAARLAQG